jgi:hypothetical protein
MGEEKYKQNRVNIPERERNLGRPKRKQDNIQIHITEI